MTDITDIVGKTMLQPFVEMMAAFSPQAALGLKRHGRMAARA
jgi:hypothetical protein